MSGVAGVDDKVMTAQFGNGFRNQQSIINVKSPRARFSPPKSNSLVYLHQVRRREPQLRNYQNKAGPESFVGERPLWQEHCTTRAER